MTGLKLEALDLSYSQQISEDELSISGSMTSLKHLSIAGNHLNNSIFKGKDSEDTLFHLGQS